jgi:hypothetical protein
MGLISKFLKLNAVVLTGGAAFTAYQYPELRKEPYQLSKAMYRGMRCMKAGTLIAYDYLYVCSIL